ncbi:MAG TPA: peptidylprolyl isomerase [Thermodesulfobacteriota bacterium]|nr:peptidylprolyl isomerase [Thermodesulfobacteriota bacterium]
MKLGNIDFYAGMSGLAVKLLLVAVLVPAMLVTVACKQKDNSAQNTAQSAPAGDTSETQGGNPVVIISTSKGDIKVELLKNEAPVTVENFLSYVNDGFYDGTIFHRVIPNFMIQGGGFTSDFAQKPTKAPIKNEANNGLKNDRGTLAMARTQVVDSATSQFFINVVDNDFLNNGARDFGYAVFGKVIDGMDVVDAIAAVPTSNKGMHGDVPTEDVVIESVKVVE